jgi:hypothetical protein
MWRRKVAHPLMDKKQEGTIYEKVDLVRHGIFLCLDFGLSFSEIGKTHQSLTSSTSS